MTDEVVSAAQAAQLGLRHITELTGREPSGVTSLEPSEDGWLVGVEVVEDRRLPSSIDLLGLYLAEIGADGELLAYRRIRRYPRGKGGDNGEVG
ncbi:gas vesicle protein [Plantactinospora siamensis]|uniref:Gas vesicle protein n=1 Tax=Plantactinospora siamensis TaxID=555372 RepID=A0ABV6NUD0_9ACTN